LFVFKQKTRQGLLLIAVSGMFLSSFSLILLQGVMNGLQRNLKDRSITILGAKVIDLNLYSSKKIDHLLKSLNDNKISYSAEFELEGLIEKSGKLRPVIIHGVFPDSQYMIEKGLLAKMGALMPIDLAIALELRVGESFKFISPSYVDSFLDDLPRSTKIILEKTLSTDVPEIDTFHLWIPVKKLHNLSREIVLNRIRLFSNVSNQLIKKLISPYVKTEMRIQTWEERHSSLVWALRLEKMMMIFLFCAMTILVSLSISSGMLIFIKKIKHDLTGLWILGGSKRRIFNLAFFAIFSLCVISIFSGVAFGSFVLHLIDTYSGNIMPDIFVERKLPVHLSLEALIISLAVPLFVSSVFSYVGLNEFRKDNDYLKIIRSVG